MYDYKGTIFYSQSKQINEKTLKSDSLTTKEGNGLQPQKLCQENKGLYVLNYETGILQVGNQLQRKSILANSGNTYNKMAEKTLFIMYAMD